MTAGFNANAISGVAYCEVNASGCAPLGLATAGDNVGAIDSNLSPLAVPAALCLFASATFALLGPRRRSKTG